MKICVVSDSQEAKHIKSSKKSEKIRGKIRVKIRDENSKISFCDFSDLKPTRKQTFHGIVGFRGKKGSEKGSEKGF